MRLPVLIAVLLLASAAVSSAATTRAGHNGPLTGTWKGYLAGTVGGTTKRERIVLTVNARETAGSWKVSASCHGTLTLDSISGGYHHYRRHLARGSSCAGGDIDCLWPHGTTVYDSVTPRPNGWSRDGTLRRVTTG